MPQAVHVTNSLNEDGEFAWASTLDRLIERTEASEASVAVDLEVGADRKSTGSFYTPADVAQHTWDQFFDLNQIASGNDLRSFIKTTRLVEPSAGSGVFVLTFLRKALALGLTPRDLAHLHYSVIDINIKALRFLSRSLSELEMTLGVSLSGIVLVERDFLDWAKATTADRVAFVGNPPFVANQSGSRWKNLFADFLESMLKYQCNSRAIALILPMSICFSRDYSRLRALIQERQIGIRAATYDNIPDCLFKSGKPESTNTNKANSQRCTILLLGGSDGGLREAACMRRWAVSDRKSVLSALPTYFDFSKYSFDDQFPRPICQGVMTYLAAVNASSPTLGDLIQRSAKPTFATASVARNFIGIREVQERDSATIPIGSHNPSEAMLLLQILSSPAFYEYWQTLGDGFHVTRGLIDRFPVSDRLVAICRDNQANAEAVWRNRECFARTKLNKGKTVKSYDFRSAFSYIDFR